MYLRNSWYVAAWDHEVTEKPLGRVLLGDPVVLYRTASGQPVALEDRCRHRRATLSLGRVLGDRLQCGYHGMTFDTSGKCVDMPGQDNVPECQPLRAYPVVERHRWVWVWMGEAEKADPAAIPDLSWHTDPAWVTFGERFHVKADYQLLMDIQLDNTHARYVHPTTLANDGAIFTRPKVRRDGEKLQCERLMPDSDPPPLFRMARNFGKTADYWIRWTFVPPSTAYFDAGAAEVNTGGFEGNRDHAAAIHTAHAITPEVDGTCHHFWSLSRDFAIEDEAVTKKLYIIRETFLEDVAMVEATQRIIDLDPKATFVDVNADNPTIQARLLVSRAISAEQQSSAKTRQAS